MRKSVGFNAIVEKQLFVKGNFYALERIKKSEVVYLKEIVTELWQMIPDGVKWCIGIVCVLVFVGRIVAEVYSAYKTKGLSGAVEKLCEVNGIMKKDKSKYVQDYTGSNLKKEYRYNSATKELVETGGTIDVQKQIDSYKETSLDAMLDKFLPTETAESVAEATYNRTTDRLDELAKLVETANKYREEFGMSDDVSITAIYDEMSKRSAALRLNLEKYQSIKKEVNNNEKVDDKESK